MVEPVPRAIFSWCRLRNVRKSVDFPYNEKYDRITEEMEELSQEPSAFIKVEFKQKDALSKVR